MFHHLFQISFRSLWKNKTITLINIFGLAIGMAISLLSMLYVANELSFDRFHEHVDKIFRLVVRVESAQGTETSSIMTAGVGPSVMKEVPEVDAMVRVSNPREAFLNAGGQNYDLGFFIYADSSFFRLFSFDLLLGNPIKVLEEPYSLVLSRSMADKMFGSASAAVGQVVMLNDRDKCLVTGVVDDPPVNSHLRFDALCSFTSLYEDPQMYLGWNGGWNYFTYILVHDGATVSRIEEQLADIAERNINQTLQQVGVSWHFSLQTLRDVHLNDNINWDIETQGSPVRLVLFIAVTFIILVIACINFINLTTAAALGRMKEVGVRKIIGASRRQVIQQFLVETMVLSIVSLVLAFFFVEFFSMWLAREVNDVMLLEHFTLYNKSFVRIALAVIFLVVLVGLVAGAYPALYMSKFKPALAIKGRVDMGSRSPAFRNLLVVFQFTISVAMIIAVLVIATQLDYLLTSDKGFPSGNKIVIPLATEASREKVEVLKTRFLQIPGIEKAGASSDIPGRGFTQNGYFPEGHDQPLMFHALDVDQDFIDALGLKIVRGRNFSTSYGTDRKAYIINEALARQLGWDRPVGKVIRRGEDHPVIGMVSDFNYSTMHDAIGPLVITMDPWRGYSYILLQSSVAYDKVRDELERAWDGLVPNEDFDPFTLSSYVHQAYGPEKEYLHMLLFCAGLSLIIAALGLFGLAAFLTRKRYREIAVRKVFGAGTRGIIARVSSGFLLWVLVANVIAAPLAYWVMQHFFLAGFAYNGGIPWWIFVAALFFSVLIAFLVIFFQVFRLGRLNPVDIIRYE